MKIRFEKLEIEIPREMVDTIGVGLLKLREFDARARAAEENSRQSLIAVTLNRLLEGLYALIKPAVPAAEPQEPPEPAQSNTDD